MISFQPKKSSKTAKNQPPPFYLIFLRPDLSPIHPPSRPLKQPLFYPQFQPSSALIFCRPLFLSTRTGPDFCFFPLRQPLPTPIFLLRLNHCRHQFYFDLSSLAVTIADFTLIFNRCRRRFRSRLTIRLCTLPTPRAPPAPQKRGLRASWLQLRLTLLSADKKVAPDLKPRRRCRANT